MTMHAKRYQNSAALLIIMRCTNTFEPVEPAEPLLREIKGQLDQRLTLNPQSHFSFAISPVEMVQFSLLMSLIDRGGALKLLLLRNVCQIK